MRRAALYCWNRGALVVVDDGEPPVIVDGMELDAATTSPERLAAMVTSNGVDRLLVTSEDVARGGRKFPDAALELAAALTMHVGPGIAVDVVLDENRKAHRGAARKLCPPGSGSEATRDALAMVLANMGAAAPAIVYQSNVAPPAIWREVDTAVHEVPSHPPVIEAPSPVPDPMQALGELLTTAPRVAGIDPGERWIAVCVGAETSGPGSSVPLTYVASLVVEIERTGKEQPTDEQLDAAVGKAVDFCELHGVERAAVERAVNVHRKPGASPEEGAGMAAYLLRGQYVAGMLRGALRAARNAAKEPLIPGKVESVSSVKGRNHVRRLAGTMPSGPRVSTRREAGQVAHVSGAVTKIHGTAETCPLCYLPGGGIVPPWQPAARAAFGGTIPAGVGEHVLDAAVAAVWAVRPEEAPAPPKAPREPGAPGKPRKGGHAVRAAKMAADRAAAGCKCPLGFKGARHGAGCPIRAAELAKKGAKMAGNANARRGA